MNTWRHTTLRDLRAKYPSIRTGRLQPSLTKKERAGLAASWSVQQRNHGFHKFCKSIEKEEVNRLLLERQTRLREEAEDRGEEYVEEELFSSKHIVKAELWKQLSKEEKDKWRKEADEEEEKPEVWMDQ
jgi:hypothetical protein